MSSAPPFPGWCPRCGAHLRRGECSECDAVLGGLGDPPITRGEVRRTLTEFGIVLAIGLFPIVLWLAGRVILFGAWGPR